MLLFVHRELPGISYNLQPQRSHWCTSGWVPCSKVVVEMRRTFISFICQVICVYTNTVCLVIFFLLFFFVTLSKDWCSAILELDKNQHLSFWLAQTTKAFFFTVLIICFVVSCFMLKVNPWVLFYFPLPVFFCFPATFLLLTCVPLLNHSCL